MRITLGWRLKDFMEGVLLESGLDERVGFSGPKGMKKIPYLGKQ
jgi:hypothetical protein